MNENMTPIEVVSDGETYMVYAPADRAERVAAAIEADGAEYGMDVNTTILA